MSETILTVGAGKQYATINAAIQAADRMGGNADIRVDAGTYVNDGGYLYDGVDNVTIEGVGGTVTIEDPAYNAGGKAAIVTGGQNIVLRNLDISGVSVPDANGAAIRYDQGTLTLDHVHLHDNQEGILGAADPTGSITIQNSEIDHNGTDAGNTHNIYIGDIARFTLTNSYVHDANVGHEVKSRAENNVITGNIIADNDGSASYSIDLPNGGNAVISGNLIEQGANSENHTINAYGEEGGLHAGTGVVFSGNQIVNDNAGGNGPLWLNDGATIAVSGNTVWNLNTLGGLSAAGFTALATRPDLAGQEAAFQASGTPPAPSPAVTQVLDSLQPGDVYRFFETSNGTQFLTSSADEIRTILQTRPDLVFEGPAFGTPQASSDPAAVPVYRFFDTSNGTHFYTVDPAERQSILAGRPDMVDEGSSFSVDTSAQPGDVAVYRYFETSNGAHFFTSDPAERASIAVSRPDMVAEGVAFYVPGA